MKKIILFFLFAFYSNVIFTQNYQSIKDNGIYLFAGTYGDIKTIRIDSVAQNGQDTVLYNFYSIRVLDSITNCYTPLGASWLGKYVIIKSDGFNYFFNNNNDTIKINTLAPVFESYKCYSTSNGSNIAATVISIDTMSFLGIIDSVKTISFQYKDSLGTSIQNPVNNYKIKLSKNYGLINILDFYTFPNVTDSLKIIGTPNLIGKQNLTSQRVFDYNIGDEFHYSYHESYLSSYIPYSKDSIRILKVLNKNVTQDSVTYTFKRCEKDVKRVDTNFITTSYYNDTINTTIIYANVNKLIDKYLPEESILEYNNTHLSNLKMKFAMNKRTNKILPSQAEMYLNNSGDECWSEIFFDGCAINCEYIEGCGGPYYYCMFGLTEYKSQLLYYKKGNEEWGTPLNCDAILNAGINENNNNANISIYPNPVKDNLTIETNANQEQRLEILNLFGQTIYTIYINKKAIINTSAFANGVYILKIYSDKETIVKKFIKE